MSEVFDLLSYAKDKVQELTRTVEIKGASVDVKFVSMDAWRKVRRRVGQVQGSNTAKEEAAIAAQRAELTKAVVGWRGMTRDVVAGLMPVDPVGLPDELPYHERNVQALLLHSGEFFNAISAAADDLESFREAQKSEARGN